MKKILFSMLVVIVCVSLLLGCDNILPDHSDSPSTNETSGLGGERKYKVEILNADSFDIINELKESYAAGEKVTIQLATITEHYYLLYVNGVEQERDDLIAGDWTITAYSFIMPNEDVIIKIEDRWVDIPYPDNETGLN
ncbi:MAG: hypothetical protein E7659_05935 [Ruminococcaceae bacterium]|nr:hypothetical protein [Oscillospiraceae bacterium]